MAEEFSWSSSITRLLEGQSLSDDETAAAMSEIMEGAATPAQIAGFVVALRSKGETTDEIVGLVRAMRSFALKVEAGDDVVDTCGTGGDRAGTFNVSTAAAIVCAGAGARVAKHGNRAASSKCGSADVLEELGVKLDLQPAAVATCIDEAGMGFCFAPIFHPAMRHAGVTRRELGIPTIFNFLGPLTNPAGAKRQALGVSDPRMVDKMVETLRRLGSQRVVAFHGDSGLDELSLSGPSRVVELIDGETKTSEVDPTHLGFERAPLDAVKGGTAEENAAAIRAVLAGERGPRRDIVVLNTAAGLVAAGLAADMSEGVQLASQAIDSGSASDALDKLIEVSNSQA
ncbi:MAG TPA: anthranilate phosphoribosyltransferase [Actinomycetota bacterium]|nr:anthranilate phosphoribosyltransferase [Actinomycetota bacterium]